MTRLGLSLLLLGLLALAAGALAAWFFEQANAVNWPYQLLYTNLNEPLDTARAVRGWGIASAASFLVLVAARQFAGRLKSREIGFPAMAGGLSLILLAASDFGYGLTSWHGLLPTLGMDWTYFDLLLPRIMFVAVVVGAAAAYNGLTKVFGSHLRAAAPNR